MKRLNLLPPEERVKASRHRGRLYAVLGLVVVVLALGAVYFQQRSVLNGKEAELAQANSELAAVQQKVAALQPYAQINNLRTAMTQTAQEIYDARVPWSRILEEVSLVIPDNVRLSDAKCTVPDAMLPGAEQVAATTAVNSAPAPDITFSGDTYSHKDVAEFMTRLGLIPQLANIQLTDATRANEGEEGSGATTISFTVTASLREYLTAPPTTTLQKTGAAQ